MAPKFHDLTIAEITPLTPDAVAITFDVPDALKADYSFTPGQYLTLRTQIGGADTRRSYSICSTPDEARLTVGVRHVPGGCFSSHANTAFAAGDTLSVMTPEGRFCPTQDETNLLLIGAGSGITPLLSIAATALAEGKTVTLLLGNRQSGSIMFRETLERLKDRYMERFTLVHVLSREDQDVPLFHGRIDETRITALAKAAILPRDADAAFLCGPEEMIETARSALISLGYPETSIRREVFTPSTPPGAVPEPSVETMPGTRIAVRLDGARKEFTATRTDDTILTAATRAGVDLPFSCTGGMCSTCRCRITEGAGEMTLNYALEPWEIEAGFTLACQTRPTTDRITLDFDAA